MEKNIEEAKKWLRRAAEAGSQEAVEKLKILEKQKGYILNCKGNLNVGDSVFFGNYPQNSKEEKEPIEWRVLDVKDDKALLISKYALDCMPYNIEWGDTSWERCTLRKWLNSDFIKEAFTDNEQNSILLSDVYRDENHKYGTSQDNNILDKVFLLNSIEAERYFKSDDDRKCVLTKLTVRNGAYKYNEPCWWWLQSLGWYNNCIEGVGADGSVDCLGNYVDTSDNAVRPALWINLKS